MNCLEFESRLELFARGALSDARARAAAEAHAESCGPCAARLADERALSAGMRALAAGMKRAEAPARVESALLAAFRAQAAPAASAVSESSDAVAASKVVQLSGHAPARRWSWAKTVAVASLAAAASVALFVLVRPDAQPAAPARTAMLEPPPITSGGPPTVTKSIPTETVEKAAGQQPAPELAKVGTQRAAFVSRNRPANVSYATPRPLARPAAAEASAPEVATEFIPLVQADASMPAEDGHLIRVELPRTALASFGLPVNAEAEGGRVKADVLMGQDGVARAIRFVR